MPKFKKSTGYKMNGFSGFKSSPAKQAVTAADIRGAVNKVNKSKSRVDKDGNFIQPGWAQGLGKAWEGVSGQVDAKIAKGIEKRKESKKNKKEMEWQKEVAAHKTEGKDVLDATWDENLQKPLMSDEEIDKDLELYHGITE